MYKLIEKLNITDSQKDVKEKEIEMPEFSEKPFNEFKYSQSYECKSALKVSFGGFFLKEIPMN